MNLRSRRVRILGSVIAAVVVLYVLLGFFVAPMIVRSQLEKRASAALGGRAVSVARVRVNPLVFSLTIDGLRVADRDPAAGDLASWQEAYVNFDPLTSLFKLEWHFADVRLVEPKQRLAIDASGRLNVADLFEASGENSPAPSADARATTPPAEGSTGKLPAIGIGRLSVENWSVDFTDQSRHTPFHTVAGPMTFGVTAFTTRPQKESPYTFAGRMDSGERFAWSGTITAAPFGSKGTIEFAEISLPKFMPFLEPYLDGDVRSGRLGLKTSYEITLVGETMARLANTTLALDDLAVTRTGVEKPALALRRLAVDMPKADLTQRTAQIARVALDGLDVHASRLADGSIDLNTLMRHEPEAEAASGAAASNAPANASAGTAASTTADAGPAPSVRVAEFALTDGRFSLLDLSTPRAATTTMDQIAFTLRDLGTDLDHEISVTGKHRWCGSGTFEVSGKVRVLPFAAALDVKAEGLALAPLDPYLEPQIDARIKTGDLRFAGHIDAAITRPDQHLTLTWTGDAGIDGLATVDGRAGGNLLAWKNLSFNGTKFSLDPLEFSAKEIALSEPVAELTVEKDGTLNLAAALHHAPSGAAASDTASATNAATAAPGATSPQLPPPAPAPTNASAPEKTSARVASATKQSLPFKAAIDAITIEGGRFHVADHSFAPGYTTELRDFGGSIRGLSSENVARADVDLHGSLDGVAPLRIAGTINPLAEDRFSDIKVLFNNIDLPPFTPYSGRFLGQKIQKGKLRVDLAYRVSQNVLEGENRVLLDQFYLGDHVESPEAIKMPIGLAIKLLRNRDGQINLDVPVRGNLDDPDFKWGRVVWQAIGNIIVKAATSPFSMLGGLLPSGKGEDLKSLEFASGSAEISDAGATKLEALAKALHEHPDLQLEINSPPAPAADREGLLEAKFMKLLVAEKQNAAANPAGDATANNADATTIAPEERDALLRQAFVRKFPEEASAVALSEAHASASGAETTSSAASTSTRREPIRQPGFLERVVGRLFGRDDNANAGGSGVSSNSSNDAGTPPSTQPSSHAPRSPSVSSGSSAAMKENASNGSAVAITAAPPPGPTKEEMRLRLLATIELTEEDFQHLAADRARVVRDRILAGGDVEPERVFLVEASQQGSPPEVAEAPSTGSTDAAAANTATNASPASAPGTAAPPAAERTPRVLFDLK